MQTFTPANKRGKVYRIVGNCVWPVYRCCVCFCTAGNIFSALLAAGSRNPLYQKGKGKTKHLLLADFKCDDTFHTVNTFLFWLFLVWLL